VAHPTVGTPDTLTGHVGAAPYGCNDNSNRPWCNVVNRSIFASSPTWISPGVIQVWVWATSTSDAQIKVYFDACTGGNPTGYFSPSTISLNVVAASGWQQLYASVPLPNGLLLPANYQLCVSMAAYTLSGTPTVTLGATSPHYTRINGPWMASGANAITP
jgi:hypothetical protein